MPLTSLGCSAVPKNCSGFTLLELMVTVSIAAVLLGVAIPSFFEAIRSNRLTSNANQLVTAINLARSEAVKRGMPVTVRRADANSATNVGAAANWEDGWDVFVDRNANGIFNDDGDANPCEIANAVLTEDCLLKTFAALDSTYTLRGNSGNAPNNFTANLTLDVSGRSRRNDNSGFFVSGSFILCEDRDANGLPEANSSRLILVNSVGRVSMGVDTNDDGIPNTDSVASAASNIASCTPI